MTSVPGVSRPALQTRVGERGYLPSGRTPTRGDVLFWADVAVGALLGIRVGCAWSHSLRANARGIGRFMLQAEQMCPSRVRQRGSTSHDLACTTPYEARARAQRERDPAKFRHPAPARESG